MKIIYILKKGLQYYPPCLAQVLNLSDLGISLILYTGKNSENINNILDGRKIEHHTFESDVLSKNKIESAKNLLRYKNEVKNRKYEIFSQYNNDTVIWIGNVETALAFNAKDFKEYHIILNVLELYDINTLYDKYLHKVINYAFKVISCEKHRAAIMKGRYKLKELPLILPNKPYDFAEQLQNKSLEKELSKYKSKFIIVYQGMISKDRPLGKIAKALAKINDEDIYFFILGRCNNDFKNYISKIYDRTVFWNFVPAPDHLIITKYCNVGVANYDFSNENNIFCAPNKIYEYSKFGLPMICSENIGLTETVGDSNAGLCIDFNNENKIVSSIYEIKNDYKIYSQNAKKFYENTNNYQILKDFIMEVETQL